MDKYLKKRVAQWWSEDNTSSQANKVVVTYKFNSFLKLIAVVHSQNVQQKIRICHYASVKRCANFSLKCAKSVGRPAPPEPAGGAYSAPQIP